MKRARSVRIFLALSLACILLLLFRPEEAADAVRSGLLLCVRTVIPSLFPFMVLSELLILCGAGEVAGHIFSGPMKRLFGISGAGSCSLFLGSVCGFPVGARTAVSMYDKGLLSRREVEHLLTFSNNPSSAFLISAVGVTLLSSRALGVVLYGVSLFSAALVGFAGHLLLSRKKERRAVSSPRSYPLYGGAELFTGAVRSAAESVITVCAFVVFFSALLGTLTPLLGALHLPGAVHALLRGAVEMTGGVQAAAALPDPFCAAVLCAVLCGWSGLSVHLQIIAVCGGRGISFFPYLIAKLAQAILCGALVALILTLFPSLVSVAGEVNVGTFSFLPLTLPSALTYPVDLIFLFALLLSPRRKRQGTPGGRRP